MIFDVTTTITLVPAVTQKKITIFLLFLFPSIVCMHVSLFCYIVGGTQCTLQWVPVVPLSSSSSLFGPCESESPKVTTTTLLNNNNNKKVHEKLE